MIHQTLPLVLVLSVGLAPVFSLANDVRQESSVSVSSVVTDNISQANEDEAEADISLQLTPAIRLSSQGGRGGWVLELSADAETFLQDNQPDRIEPNLFALTEVELVPERFFMLGGLSLRQVFSESRARGPGSRGAALGEEQEGVFSAFINPSWQVDLSGNAQFLADYRGEYVNADQDSGYNHTLDLTLVSGRSFSRLDWQLRYLGEWSQPNNAETTQNQEFRAEVDYPLGDDWSLSGVAGYITGEGVNNQGGDIESGAYWSVGGIWRPGRRIQARVLLGPHNREYYLSFRPTVRTDLELSLRDINIGQDPGRTWEANFRHRSRYGVWVLRYEETTTSQLESEVNEVTGDPIFDEVDDVLDPASTLGTSDERFFRRRLQASVDYSRRRTQIGIRTAYEARDFLTNDDDSRTWELGFNWRWLLGRRTTAVLDIAWEHAHLQDGDDEVFISTQVGLDYRFSPDMQGFVGFSHLRLDAADDDNDYRENRLGLLLRMGF